ncbi:hypothetical protein MTO96_011714 [Rhipicephalus appendiculatus]
MAPSAVSAKNDTSFGLDSRSSWVTAVFLSVTLATVLIGQHSVGVLFYGIVHTYDVSRKDASWPLVLSQSLSFLAGAAAGGVHVAVNVLASQHFKKRRTTACSIIYTFIGINSLYLPPLAEFLRVTYGIRGTFLMLGGLILHSLPPVLAVRSPAWAKPRRQCPGSTVTELGNVHSEVTLNELLLPANGTQDYNNSDDSEVSLDSLHKTEFTELPLGQNGQLMSQWSFQC